jgi:hypothetical protein
MHHGSELYRTAPQPRNVVKSALQEVCGSNWHLYFKRAHMTFFQEYWHLLMEQKHENVLLHKAAAV